MVRRGISSSGRALALHARGAGIDTRILHFVFRIRIVLTFSAVYEIKMDWMSVHPW